jgi:hypothetical protein
MCFEAGPPLRQEAGVLLFLCQRVNTATSSPADDVHHYVISQKLLLTNIFYFQQTSGIHAPVGKRIGCSLSGRSPAPIADSSIMVELYLNSPIWPHGMVLNCLSNGTILPYLYATAQRSIVK